jgi:hypothetical protein
MFEVGRSRDNHWYARKGGGEARHASDFGLCTSGWMQLAM